MNRRNLFKMLGAMAVSAVCAPLVKLLPERKNDAEFMQCAMKRFNAKIAAQSASLKDLKALMRKTDADLKAVTGIYKPQ